MTDADHPALSRQVIEMITVAHEYCLFFEKAEKYDKNDIFGYFQKIAPLLYIKGAMLPEMPAVEPEYFERFVNEEQWEEIFRTMRRKLEDQDTYYILDHNNDTQETSLSDNIADVYQDMKDFVLLYQKAPLQSKICAVAELGKLFENHWGMKITQALGAIHNKLYSESINPDLLSEYDSDDL